MDKKSVIKLHVIFWIIVLSISLLGTLTYFENPLITPLFMSTLAGLLCNVITFYLFYTVVSQGIFIKKRIILLVLLGLLYLAVSSFIFSFIYYYSISYFYPAPVPAEFTLVNWMKKYIFSVIARNAIFLILGSLSKVSLVWYRNKLKQMETEKQNMSNELAMLRAQINPHFLFNTLNNIKSLIKSLPSKAIYSIDKLTGMMHYMLYESSYETVPLVNEIRHINNYLDLEKIRYSDQDFINFKVSGDYSKINVPPLIFMPFIENAFKHGNKLKPAPGIIIKIDVFDKKILFEIRNFIKENPGNQNKNSGFGFSNIRRRLDLLFDKKYELKINTEDKTFTVKLNLNLS
jgi:two-component system, LytTR family, sensor kinase